MTKHGKRLMKGMSKSRKGSISVGIEKLLKATRIDKTAAETSTFVTFGSEVLKMASYYAGSQHGTTTTAGVQLGAAEEGAPENTLVQQILAKPKQVKTSAKTPDPDEFKVTKREAERAARRLASQGATPRRIARNMGTFAVLSPVAGTIAKGVSAAALAKKNRGRAAYGAMKGVVKDRGGLVEKSVGGAIAGAALTALSEGRDVRRSRNTVESYLKETRSAQPTRKKLKAVL